MKCGAFLVLVSLMLLLSNQPIEAESSESSGTPPPEIFNGTISSNPSIVALVVNRRGHSIDANTFCSGVLVSPIYVLTAQHCHADANGRPYRAIIGRSRTTDTTQGEVRQILWRFTMPGYPGPGQATNGDLMLLRLDQPSNMPPMPLAVAQWADRWDPGSDIRIFGYGETQPELSDNLQQRNMVARVNTLDPQDPSGLTPNEKMVATWSGRSLCEVDSGGPWTILTPNGRRVVGISSLTYNPTCTGTRGQLAMIVASRGSVDNSPGFNWVRQCLNNGAACTDGTR